jgi:hypothetical protein
MWCSRTSTGEKAGSSECSSSTDGDDEGFGVRQADRTLVAEQKRTDFRPPEEGEAPPLDRPTDACVLVAALLSALLRLTAQHLQGSNLASFDAEVCPCLAPTDCCWSSPCRVRAPAL